MGKSAVIIFVRNPELGKVKTRLAETIGKEKALLLYNELLRHTRDITMPLSCDKFLFYADRVTREDMWDNDIYDKRLQKGVDLGDRMHHAFSTLFTLCYTDIIIIGSDCFELSGEMLEAAFEKLKSKKIIIGPAGDGGYYLLGLHMIVPEIFQHMRWSSSAVLSDTLMILERLQYAYLLLPTLNDIDEETDLPDELRIKVGITGKILKA